MKSKYLTKKYLIDKKNDKNSKRNNIFTKKVGGNDINNFEELPLKNPLFTRLSNGLSALSNNISSIPLSNNTSSLSLSNNNNTKPTTESQLPILSTKPSLSIEPQLLPSSIEQQYKVIDKPSSKDIISLLKVIFHESWFQDQFLDILSKNIKTQYFNKILEVTLFNIFNNILDNINKNDNIILTISILKNNTKYFEELLKESITNNKDFYENEKIYPSNDNVLRISTNTSLEYSRSIIKNFRILLLPDTKTPLATQISDEKKIEFENIRAKYLLDLEKEKIKLEEEEKEYKEKKNKDREKKYEEMINQNIQSKINTEIDENSINKIMKFFNNIENSINDNNDNSAIINGERYNEMIIRTICDCIKDMLEKEDSTKEIIRIILNRFDYMLKEFIDIMQNNGIIKLILLRIFDNYPFIFISFQQGTENALNKKIEYISNKKAITDTYIVKNDIMNDYAFFNSIINNVIDNLTKQLEIFIPSEENPNNIEGGGNKKINNYNHINTPVTKKKIELLIKKKTLKKKHKLCKKPPCGWFW